MPNVMTPLLTPLLSLAFAAVTNAQYVAPQLGGGSPGASGSMKHADVMLDPFGDGRIEVVIDDSVASPRLRPLIAPDAFDPARPEAVLAGKAYNAQFGWNPNGFILLPAGGAFWIEELAASPGLETYQAPPESPAFEPIFGTAGSPLLWKWSTTRMVHNYYAIEDLTSGPHWATYRIYVGDATGGEPIDGYAPAEVTFEFALPGDYNNQGVVDADDFILWRGAYGASGPDLDSDGNGDGVVDAADYTLWRDHAASAAATTIPEPCGVTLIFALLAQALASRRRKPPE